MKVYLVRHAESELNPTDIFQYDETPLSETGKRQAKLLAERFKSISADFIYSSKLLRAKQTAEILSKALGLQIEYIEELRERKRASSIIGKRVSEVKESIRLIREKRHDPDFRLGDSESFNQIKKRTQKIMEHLAKHHSGQNVLVVTHGIVLRMFVALVCFGKQLVTKEFYKISDTLRTTNTGITVLEYRKKDGWALITWNDSAHLGPPSAPKPKKASGF